MARPKNEDKPTTSILVKVPKGVKARLKYTKAMSSKKFTLAEAQNTCIKLGIKHLGSKTLKPKIKRDEVNGEPFELSPELNLKIEELQEQFSVESKQDVIIQLLRIGVTKFKKQ